MCERLSLFLVWLAGLVLLPFFSSWQLLGGWAPFTWVLYAVPYLAATAVYRRVSAAEAAPPATGGRAVCNGLPIGTGDKRARQWLRRVLFFLWAYYGFCGAIFLVTFMLLMP